MAGRFVRASKYRHIFGRPVKKEQCFDNLRISKNAWDSNIVKANPVYLAVNWEASGGGAIAVIPLAEQGRLPEQIPLFRGHTAPVLDTDWNPFNDSLLASGSDDGKVFVWKVPDNFSLHTDAENIPHVGPVARLSGHQRKVGHILFNPAAENILASSSGDFCIKIWDLQAEEDKFDLQHPEMVQSMSWNAKGSLMVTSNRDKSLRVWDVRQQKVAQETAGHGGAKNCRTAWMGEHDRFVTTGFSRMSDRQLGLWDIRALKEPIGGFMILDSMSGVCIPFWDEDTNCLYLAGKGDGNIRYFEYQNDKFEYLSEHKSIEPQRGIAFVPKRAVDVRENEISRAYRTVADSYIEPVSFIVPRRSETFQADIYPPTTGSEAAVSSDQWLDGQDGLPPKISLQSVYEDSDAKRVANSLKSTKSSHSDDNLAVRTDSSSFPAQTTTMMTTKKLEAAAVADKPKFAASTKISREIADNKTSIANAVSKFVDDKNSSSEDERSSDFSQPNTLPSRSCTSVKTDKEFVEKNWDGASEKSTDYGSPVGSLGEQKDGRFNKKSRSESSATELSNESSNEIQKSSDDGRVFPKRAMMGSRSPDREVERSASPQATAQADGADSQQRQQQQELIEKLLTEFARINSRLETLETRIEAQNSHIQKLAAEVELARLEIKGSLKIVRDECGDESDADPTTQTLKDQTL